MATRIQHRRGTAAQWAATNPVLSEGELGFVKDTGSVKVGDGVTAWNDLDIELETREHAKGTYVPMTDLVSKLPRPFYISHRGGPLRFPEHSMRGYRESARAGFCVEPDLATLADGTLVCHHDGTVDRTTNGTGNVSSLTRAQWDALLTDYQPTSVQGVDPERGAYWDDVLAEFGGRVVLCPEPKGADVTARTKLLDSITSRGLHRAVIVQSFSYDDVKAAAARGIVAMHLTNVNDPATMKADGLWGVGITSSATDAYIAACKAQGLVVVAWTINWRTAAAAGGNSLEALSARGVDGYFTDDPWWLSERGRVPLSNDPFVEGVPWPGFHQNGTNDPSNFSFHRRGELSMVAPTHTARFVRHEWAGTRAPAGGLLRVRFEHRFGGQVQADDSRWFSVWLGKLSGPEALFDDVPEAGQQGYHFLFRRNGITGSYYVADGQGAVLVGATAQPAQPIVLNSVEQLDWHEYEVEITATHVIQRNLTRGLENSQAHALYRGPYLLGMGWNGTRGRVRNVRIIEGGAAA